MDIYIGTYTEDSESDGIYHCSFDAGTGELAGATLAVEAENPSFLAKDSQSDLVYAASEVDLAEVLSFSRRADGSLMPVDRVRTGGSAACHVAFSSAHAAVFAANYVDGSVMGCPVGVDGRFNGLPQTLKHSGKSIDPERQEGPHAHSVNIDPEGSTLLVADLGTDSIVAYRIGEERGRLEEIAPARGNAIAGSGPRHMVFHPNGRVVYCLNELTSTVTKYDYVPGEALDAIQTVPGLPDDFAGVSTAADIHLDASARFLYSSNRGHNSVAVFRIDDGAGLLPVGHVSTGGENPRNFALIPDSPYLLVANQDSDSIVIFRVGSDGIPVATGSAISVPRPVCLLPV
jgi:6-phosphogluconolactonase